MAALQPDCICVDIGNTSTTLGFFKGDETLFLKHFSNALSPQALRLELEKTFAQTKQDLKLIDCPIGLASVVPEHTLVFSRVLQEVLTSSLLVVLGEQYKIPIENRTKQPEQVGQDRLLNALAAFHLYKSGAIVLDFGTALTFDLISEDGAYLGGLITPGIELCLKALHGYTSLLPLVQLSKTPPEIFGRNSEEAIQSGIYYGFQGLVENIVKKLSGNFSSKPKVIVTGGGISRQLMNEFGEYDSFCPHLTLTGIRLTLKHYNLLQCSEKRA